MTNQTLQAALNPAEQKVYNLMFQSFREGVMYDYQEQTGGVGVFYEEEKTVQILTRIPENYYHSNNGGDYECSRIFRTTTEGVEVWYHTSCEMQEDLFEQIIDGEIDLQNVFLLAFQQLEQICLECAQSEELLVQELQELARQGCHVVETFVGVEIRVAEGESWAYSRFIESLYEMTVHSFDQGHQQSVSPKHTTYGVSLTRLRELIKEIMGKDSIAPRPTYS